MKKKKPNQQWEQFEKLLLAAESRCLWQSNVRGPDHMAECWLVGKLPVIFLVYDMGGFDVFTSHQAPGEIDKIIPWLTEQSANLD